MRSWFTRSVLSAVILGFVCATGFAGDSPRETPVVKVVRDNAPAVVNISTERIVMLRDNPYWGNYGNEFDYLFGQFFGYQRSRALKLKSVGSGVVVDKDGIIVTNAHVVHMASNIFIIFNDGRSLKGQVIYENPREDLALVRITPENPLSTVKLGSIEDLMIGETVVAIGNPLGLENSVTAGIVSGKGREFYSRRGDVVADGLIQVDAPINPGNSGGALLNLDGELVGINVAVVESSQSIGFAIPVDKVKAALQRYAKNKDVRVTQRARTAPAAPSRPAPGLSGLPDAGDPFAEMSRIHEQMERMMRDAFESGSAPGGAFNTDVFYEPSLQFEEKDNAYVMEIDIAGLDKNKINVEINERSITVSGEYSEQAEQVQPNARMRTSRFGSFSKTIPTPSDADPSGVTTETRENTMIIHLPKRT